MTKEGAPTVKEDGERLTRTESPSPANQDQTDGNASFLRAARAGNLERVLEYLKGSIDINTSNANGLNALHLASKEGHVNVVTELLKRGANVDAATKKGNTALHIASLAGQEEIVKILVQQAASVNVQSQNGFTPLYMAAQENHDSVVKFLLSNGANQSLATEDGFTPLAVALQQGHDKVVAVLLENDTRGKVRLPALHIAAKKDDCKAATLLLQNDHNPDVTSKSGFTPLHIAAHYGNENIANLLLQRGADVNFAAKHNITPMHVAAKWGKVNMVTLLLDKEANVEAKTRDGLTPLHCAARSGHDQVVDLLLEKAAPITAKTKNGLAPLHMACQGDHVDSARILLYHKAPVDDVTIDYLTALHVAAHCGHVRVAKLLLDRKAGPNARALNGFTPLHIACKKNRIKVVELLLKHGASIEATTESGLTPLHVASFMGCMNIVIYLIQHGSNPDVPTLRGETPLHLAARANQTDIIRILLRNGAHVDARAREQQTPLHIAARLGNSDIVALLLQHGAAVDSTTKDMYTALHIAAKEGQEEVASVLLEHGASLTATTKKGFTPLHLAAKYGNMKVARLLLQRDAPVDAQGKNGVTPLHVAAHYDNQNVALLLLDKGASPHATAKNGYTPLHIAAKKNQMDIATTLLEYGAKSNAESKAGFTPLHLAAQEGHTDMSTLLLEHHADVNCKAKNGLTPLHLCAQEDKVNVAAILVKNGAEIDSKTKAGYTPLHVACHFGQMNMVRFLLQHGADVNSTTAVGYTPLHQASQQGHTQIVNLLIENRASPNAVTNQGQTALSIAQRLGYISVVETLKIVTETVVTTTTTTVTEEKYRVVAPETMQETFMSDSEDEGEETMLGDQSYRYLTVDEMKSLGDDSLPIIDPTRDERMEVHILKDSLLSAAPPIDDDHISPQPPHGYAQFTGNYAPDNIDISRSPIHAGFLVSFMVDARGGAMRGCRHSGVRVIIPPRKAPMPMRITCRYLKKEKLAHPPPLMEGEACASRILEVGPTGAKFLGPVIIEVPHFASLRGKEREITILRSDDGENWREHTLEASEEAVQEVLNESFDGEELSALEDLNTNRITRILTTDFPQYFAIITRVRQEVHAIGSEGGMVSSTVVPQVQAVFPEGALTKKIKVGLQALPIPADLVAKMLGNRVAVSPVVTVEPRRRKFHKPITLTIPVPQAASRGMINQYSGETPTLRLLCSITGGIIRAQWEDVTGSTPLTFVNDCVSFTTTVSARFWLMDCRNITEATKMATELYREAIHVPFMAKFVVFAKRIDPVEAKLRVFCMTDDKEDKTLENQEHFSEVAKSRDVEVLENKPQYVEFAGNLIPVTKSGEQLALNFHAFRENRLPFIVREKDPNQEPIGRIAFMKEPKGSRSDPPQTPICNLNITLPDVRKADASPTGQEVLTLEKKYAYLKEMGLSKPETIHKADLRLSDIAVLLGNDWVGLALQLDVPESDINMIKTEYPDDVNQQALVMLRLWMQLAGNKATGNNLEKALRKINREDIVNQCIFNVELVTDDMERAVAKVRLDQSGFDSLKEELGPSREASLRRDISLDVSYDEKDIMKEAESAEETSSETGSIADQKTARAEIIDTDKANVKQDKVIKSSPGKIRPEVPKRPNLKNEPAKPPRSRPQNKDKENIDTTEKEPVTEEEIHPRIHTPTEIDAWVEYLTKQTPPSSPLRKKTAPKVPQRPKVVGEMVKRTPTPEAPRAKLEKEFEEMLKNLPLVQEDTMKARTVEPTGMNTWWKDEPYNPSWEYEGPPKTDAELMAELEASIKPLEGWLIEDKGVAKEGEPMPPKEIDDQILEDIHRTIIDEGGIGQFEIPPPRKKRRQPGAGSFGPDAAGMSTPTESTPEPFVTPVLPDLDLGVQGDGEPGRLAESEIGLSQDLEDTSPGIVDDKKGKSVQEKEWTETSPSGVKIKRKEKVITYTRASDDQDADQTEADTQPTSTTPGFAESREEDSEEGASIIEETVPFAQKKDYFQKLVDEKSEQSALEKKMGSDSSKSDLTQISPPTPAHGEVIEDMAPFAERVEFFRRSLEESSIAKDVQLMTSGGGAAAKPISPPKSPPPRPPLPSPPLRPVSPPQVVSEMKAAPVPPPRKTKQLPLKSCPPQQEDEQVSPFTPDLETPKDTPEMALKTDEQKMVMVTERVAEAVTSLASSLEEKAEQAEKSMEKMASQVEVEVKARVESSEELPPLPPKNKWKEVEENLAQSFQETDRMEKMLQKDDGVDEEGKAIKAEIKLMVKTMEPGKEEIEIRSIREFVEPDSVSGDEGEVRKIFGGVMSSDKITPTDQQIKESEESQSQSPICLHPPLITQSETNFTTQLTTTTTTTTSLFSTPQTSETCTTTSSIMIERQVRVGISPTELTLASPLVGSVESTEPSETEATVVCALDTELSSFENRAFAGMEKIDQGEPKCMSPHDTSPYEVPRAEFETGGAEEMLIQHQTSQFKREIFSHQMSESLEKSSPEVKYIPRGDEHDKMSSYRDRTKSLIKRDTFEQGDEVIRHIRTEITNNQLNETIDNLSLEEKSIDKQEISTLFPQEFDDEDEQEFAKKRTQMLISAATVETREPEVWETPIEHQSDISPARIARESFSSSRQTASQEEIEETHSLLISEAKEKIESTQLIKQETKSTDKVDEIVKEMQLISEHIEQKQITPECTLSKLLEDSKCTLFTSPPLEEITEQIEDKSAKITRVITKIEKSEEKDEIKVEEATIVQYQVTQTTNMDETLEKMQHICTSDESKETKRISQAQSSSDEKECATSDQEAKVVSSIVDKTKSGLEGESSSGSSPFYSFDVESGQTSRGTPSAASRPCSSDMEGVVVVNVPSSSEYESCRTSSQEYRTARSSLSQSSRESMPSIDSESSGNMASFEASSETSETLMPSESLDREIDTPTVFDQKSAVSSAVVVAEFARDEGASSPFEMISESEMDELPCTSDLVVRSTDHSAFEGRGFQHCTARGAIYRQESGAYMPGDRVDEWSLSSQDAGHYFQQPLQETSSVSPPEQASGLTYSNGPVEVEYVPEYDAETETETDDKAASSGRRKRSQTRRRCKEDKDEETKEEDESEGDKDKDLGGEMQESEVVFGEDASSAPEPPVEESEPKDDNKDGGDAGSQDEHEQRQALAWLPIPTRSLPIEADDDSFPPDFESDRPDSELRDLDLSHPHSQGESLYSRSDSEQRPYSELQFSDDRPDSEMTGGMRCSGDMDRPLSPEPKDEYRIEGDAHVVQLEEEYGVDKRVKDDAQVGATSKENVPVVGITVNQISVKPEVGQIVTPSTEGSERTDENGSSSQEYILDRDVKKEKSPQVSPKVSDKQWTQLSQPCLISPEDDLSQNSSPDGGSGGLHTREWLASQFNGSSSARAAPSRDFHVELESRQSDVYLHEEGLSDILEEGEEDKIEKASSKSTRSTPEFDSAFVGRRINSKNSEHDDVSMNSLQEFERLEAEMNRRSSLGSQDSLNGGRKVSSRNSNNQVGGDDASVSSLQEFEALEDECTKVAPAEEPSKAMELSEIEEGHESQMSESEGHETLSEHDPAEDSDADDYDKRMVEIDEIIRQAQTNVEKFGVDAATKIQAEKLKQDNSGSGASADATESSILDRTPSPSEVKEDLQYDEDADSLDGEETHQSALVPTSVDTIIEQQKSELDKVIVAQHVLVTQTRSSESSPHHSGGHSSASTTTQYDVDSLKDREGDSEEQECDQDSLQGDDDDPKLMMEDEEIGTRGAASVDEFDRDSLGKGRGGGEGQSMVSSTDSLEPSSSAATHATYHYETDSVMSSSFASVHTSGDESTMMSSTDTLDTESRTVHQFTPPQYDMTELDNLRPNFDIQGNFTSIREHTNEDDEYGPAIKRTVMTDPQVRTITFSGPDAELKMQEFIDKFQPGEDIVEMESTDDEGNVHMVRTVQHRVVMQPQMTTVQFTGPDAEEQLQQFMNKARQDFQSSEEEERSECSNGTTKRVIKRRIVQPESKSVTFSGPDARKQMEEFMKQTLPNYEINGSVKEYETTDDVGNATKVVRHSTTTTTTTTTMASNSCPEQHGVVVPPTHSSSTHSEDCYCGPDPKGIQHRGDFLASGDAPMTKTSHRQVRTVTTVDADGKETTTTVETEDGDEELDERLKQFISGTEERSS